MSVESWKKEFYPVPCSQAAVTPLEAVRHAIRKWMGLTKTALKRHGLRKDFNDNRIRPQCCRAGFDLGIDTCAICAYSRAQSGSQELSKELCAKHCLFLTLVDPIQDGCSFEEFPLDTGRCVPQWSYWLVKNDPWPMIKLLRATKKAIIRKRKENADND